MYNSGAPARSSRSRAFFDQVLGFRLDRGLKPGYYAGEREGVHAKAKFRRKLNLGALLTFLPTYSLQNRLLESPWYITYVISTVLGTLIRYDFLKYN